MKRNYVKVAFIGAMATVMVATTTTPCNAGLFSKTQEQQLEKAHQKEYKERKKRFEKEGWKLSGNVHTLDVALLEFYTKLNDKKSQNTQLVGQVSQCKSINVCRQAAINNAITSYASIAESAVKGKITSDLNADAIAPEAEFDKMYAAYVRNVKTEIKGQITESFAVVKDKGDGNKEFEIYFIINEEQAALARKRAMERALKETEMAQEYARKIEEFVNVPVIPE
ncbi:hypothetical protein AGMMS4956_10780 [Bacteroidia bacterium]|nr:hypothetical protein AGMMS4956_10780 [Bacteroidia bacterium]